MGITIKAHFESSVTGANKDILYRILIEGKKTIIEFDMRKRVLAASLAKQFQNILVFQNI